MNFNDEKDYIMRLINEIVRVLISLALKKQYTQVELPKENKYGVSSEKLSIIKAMVDEGKINEAENLLLDDIDYTNKEDVAKLIFFYEYANEKDILFLQQCHYSQEEILDGLKRLAEKLGYQNIIEMLDILNIKRL